MATTKKATVSKAKVNTTAQYVSAADLKKVEKLVLTTDEIREELRKKKWWYGIPVLKDAAYLNARKEFETASKAYAKASTKFAKALTAGIKK